MAPDILTKSREKGEHGFPREAGTSHIKKSGGADKDYGPDYATKGMGYALVTQYRDPVDSSKPGTVKEWSYERGYNQRPLAKNKAPEAPGAMNYGAMGPFFKV